MAGKLPIPSEVDPQNIARPNVEQTSVEEQKALAEVRRKICEQKEREILELEELRRSHEAIHLALLRGSTRERQEGQGCRHQYSHPQGTI
jgi:hypothetical protein